MVLEAQGDKYWGNINRMAQNQRQKGLKKYGMGLEDNPLTVVQRIEYLQEELIDALMYCEHLKNREVTVYIAGPMTGHPDYNYPAFYAAERVLKSRGYKVLNPAKIAVLPEYDMYLPINKAMLDGADAIYMLRGWQDSKGALTEINYAAEIGIECWFEDDEDDEDEMEVRE